MKKIIFTRPDGGVTILTPKEGARLAHHITLADGTVRGGSHNVTQALALPVDQYFGEWPVQGATADWAETEDEFVDRIRLKDVPNGATNIQVVEESAIPKDRTNRNAWKIVGGVIK